MSAPKEMGAYVDSELAKRVPKSLLKGLVGLWRSENDGKLYFVGKEIFDCGVYASERELIAGLKRRRAN